MKKLIVLFIFVLAFCSTGKACRIITNFDIARWYLDADVVLICNVIHTDTLQISHHDSLVADSFHDIYDIIKERYHLSVDSIIKSKELMFGTVDTISTPRFMINSMQRKIEFKELDENGDSIFYLEIKAFNDFNDYSYFRIHSPEKQIVMLHKTTLGCVIDYTTECDEYMMDLISEVKRKGEGYFASFFEPLTDTLPVYDHYCQSMNPHEIDTTTFKYENDTLYIRNVKNEFCCPQRLQALVKDRIDTLEINVVNPDGGDCTCDCSYGYTVKIPRPPFDSLTIRINNENFNITKAGLEQSTEKIILKDPCVFPNPFTDKIHVTGVVPKRIEIVNMNGEIQKIAIQDPQSIDVSSLKHGVYILTVAYSNHIWREKIIKE